MKDIFKIPFDEFLEVISKYIAAHKEGDIDTIDELKQSYDGFLSQEFHEEIADFLESFGLVKELRDDLFDSR